MKFKNKIIPIITALLLIASTILTINLFFQSDEEKTLIEINSSIQKEAVGKRINYPEELIPINTSLSITELTNQQPDTYLVNFIDADCSSCMEDLNLWTQYLNDNQELPPTFFILTGSDKHNVDFLVNDQLKFKPPLYFDDQELFDRYNKVSFIKAFRTYYIKNGVIQKVGSPLLLDGLID